MNYVLDGLTERTGGEVVNLEVSRLRLRIEPSDELPSEIYFADLTGDQLQDLASFAAKVAEIAAATLKAGQYQGAGRKAAEDDGVADTPSEVLAQFR